MISILAPSASAICASVSRPTLNLPFSMRAMCACCSPHRSASCAWVIPCSLRTSAILRPILSRSSSLLIPIFFLF